LDSPKVRQNGVAFVYLKNKFPRINYAKIKDGVFVGPHMIELKGDVKFTDKLSYVEDTKWKSLKNVTIIFFLGGGDHFAENHRDMVVVPVQSYKSMGCNMSLKVHFVDSLLSLLPRKSRGSER
jgi:hypothetical protein